MIESIRWPVLLAVLTFTAATFNSGTLPAWSAPAPVRYQIQVNRSKFYVSSSETGLVNATRTVAAQNVSGDVTFSGSKPDSLRVTVRANSFKSIDNLSQGDREKIERAVREPILEAEKFPVIAFRSTKISATRGAGGQYQAHINGSLTLHGVTRAVMLTAQAQLTGGTLRAKGELGLNQSDYDITLLSLLGGAISIQDPVKLTFDIIATRTH